MHFACTRVHTTWAAAPTPSGTYCPEMRRFPGAAWEGTAMPHVRMHHLRRHRLGINTMHFLMPVPTGRSWRPRPKPQELQRPRGAGRPETRRNLALLAAAGHYDGSAAHGQGVMRQSMHTYALHAFVPFARRQSTPLHTTPGLERGAWRTHACGKRRATHWWDSVGTRLRANTQSACSRHLCTQRLAWSVVHVRPARTHACRKRQAQHW